MTPAAAQTSASTLRSARRVRWVAGVSGAIGICAAGMVAWWFSLPPREGVRLHAAAQAFPWGRASSAPVEASHEPPQPEWPVPPDAAVGRTAAGPMAFDLCGLGRIVVPRAQVDDAHAPLAELPAPVGRFAVQEAHERMVNQLNAGDAKQRVAARMLHPPGDDDPAVQAAWARGLLADALASRDAQALRWAGAACPFVEDDQRCRQQLARARVQAEPGNALHWLEWASEEPEASEAAWAGLTRAQYWREQPLGLAAFSLRALGALGAQGADTPAYVRSTLEVDAMARDVGFPAPPLSMVLERCPAKGVGPARAAECERLTRLLVDKSDSVQALMLGRELGEHIGWPAAQLQRLEREVEVLLKQELRWAVDAERPLGCETVEGQRHHIAEVEREGELIVLRRNQAALPAAPR